MSRMRHRSGRGSTPSRRALAIALALGAAAALTPTLALGHVERASYWPDPAAETVDGIPVGGAVPQARDLFTALDEDAVHQTRVVCQGGQSLPYRPDQQISKRSDVQVSRDRVDRLQAKKKKAHSKGQKRKVKRLKRKLQAARQEYEAALAAEQSARQSGENDYQQRLATEMAARQAYQAQLATQPSMERLDAALAAAVANGYVLRPSEPRVQVSQQEADRLRDFNARLLAQCEYSEIQPAVNDSDNNDRVVVMPGIYTEPTSRSAPTNDPACDQLKEENDEGNTGAASYRYQFHCPNDQNLIAVMGREPDKDPVNGDANGEEIPPFPEPDDPRRDGIPDADGQPAGGGNCIRCNLQLEGSGVSPDDVVVDAGQVAAGDGQQYPDGPAEADKDVGLRADRADGFVLRNMKFRHSREHDIYIPESDGVLLERFKTRFNGEYGVLTFVADNHLIQDCDAMGSGDAAIYPGSSAEYGEQTNPNIEADNPSTPHTMSSKYGTEIRRCDMRHSSTGYSGTASNSVWVHNNDFYDNAMGFVTDVFTASGHPGFPQDSSLVENNEFYSNNFNPFFEADHDGNPATPKERIDCDSANGETPGPHGPNQGCTDVPPKIPAPVGTAIFLPGVNNNTIRNNHMWNNWRRGTMLFSVPDSFVCGANPVAAGNQQHGCDESEVNTSHRNEQYENVMGRSPAHAPDPTWPASGSNAEDPNGVDFWWDAFTGNARNCWYDNAGPEADGSGLESIPPAPLLPGDGVQNCANSIGAPPAQAFGQEAELLNCLGDFTFNTDQCDWFATPAERPPTP